MKMFEMFASFYISNANTGFSTQMACCMSSERHSDPWMYHDVDLGGGRERGGGGGGTQHSHEQLKIFVFHLGDEINTYTTV